MVALQAHSMVSKSCKIDFEALEMNTNTHMIDSQKYEMDIEASKIAFKTIVGWFRKPIQINLQYKIIITYQILL